MCIRDRSNYLGRSWQGAPIFITVEGANILSRNLMIFGQGAIRCHPYVLKEMALAGREDRDQALLEFDDLLMQHIGFAVSNAASTLILSLSMGLLGKVPGDRISRPYFRALNRLSAACQSELAYWREQLSGELPVLELALPQGIVGVLHRRLGQRRLTLSLIHI